MIALYLVAAHMLGDFVLQNRWMSRGKLAHWDTRLLHVAAYLVPFVPVAFVYGRHVAGATPGATALLFLALVGVLHFLTDSRRFRSSLADWVAWRLMVPAARADELEERRVRTLQVGEYHDATTLLRLRPTDEQAARAKVPPSEWEPLALLVDQTLHLCQLALLGGLLLR